MKISFRALVSRLMTYPILLPIMPIYCIANHKSAVLNAFYLVCGLPHGYLKKNLRIAVFDDFKIVFPFTEDPSFDDVWLRDVYYPYVPQKDDVVVDVGAHMGFFTLKVARKTKKVIAIEPHPVNFQFLQFNVSQNNLWDKVITLRIAIGKKNGLIYLDTDRYGYGRTRTSVSRGRYKVEIKSLDSVIEELSIGRVDLIKIDTEGDEVKVLEGAIKTLERYKPRLIIAAYHFRSESDLIKKFLLRTSYRLTQYYVPLVLSLGKETYIWAEPTR